MRITAYDPDHGNAVATGAAFSAAGGDLSGTLPGPTVTGIDGFPIDFTGLADGYVIVWDAAGSKWVVAPEAGGIELTDGTHDVTGVTKITVTGATVGGSTPNATLAVAGGGTDLGWYNAVTDGGLDPTGASDCCALLNTLIDTATASGTRSATIFFPAGTYLLSGALQDTGARNGQVVMPGVSTGSPQITITFIGAARPPFSWHGNAVPAPGGYSVLKSTLTGASGTAAVISGGNSMNNIEVVVTNLLCVAPDNPTFTFWNLLATQGGYRAGLMIGTASVWAQTSVTQPTHSNAYGIKLPATNNSDLSVEDSVMVFGFYTGVLHGELVEARYITALCEVGVEVPFCNHPGAHINIVATSCPYGVRFTGGANYVDIWYDAEHSYPAAGGFVNAVWAETVYDIDDGSDYWHGHARWQAILPTVGIDTFTVNGGGHGLWEQIGQPPAGAGSRTFAYFGG